MVTLELNGLIEHCSSVYDLPGTKRKAQVIRVKVNPAPDVLGRTNALPDIFEIFIYGKDDILKAWAGHNDKLPTPPVTCHCQLYGRMKTAKGKDYNNLTLRLITIKFNYDKT